MTTRRPIALNAQIAINEEFGGDTGDVVAMVAATPATIFQVVGLRGVENIALAIFNDNTNDFSAFTVEVRYHRAAPWIVIASVAADFTSPAGFIWSTGTQTTPTDTLVTLIKNTWGWLTLRSLKIVEGVRIKATSAGGNATVVGRASPT